VSEPSVVAATPADVPRISELSKLSGSGFDPAAELQRTWAKLWVLREGEAGDALGFALAWRAADEVHLLDLAVDTNARRRGVGRRLLDAVIAYAREIQGRLVLLEVRRSNVAALALYHSAGFSVEDVRRAYYSDNEDAIVMRLELAAPTTENHA
jgi:ribosomal-protein-alanine N-acetyltransferase